MNSDAKKKEMLDAAEKAWAENGKSLKHAFKTLIDRLVDLEEQVEKLKSSRQDFGQSRPK